MNLVKLAEDIKELNYVVQRNWINLPHSIEVNGHDDLDLFVSEEHRGMLEDIIGDNPHVDIRSERDMYYPVQIAALLLQNRQEYNGFYIPDDLAYFLSLYYHNAFHKVDNPYGNELKTIFSRLYTPVRCRDAGVGYFP